MKVRDSGMPERDYWESFFDPAALFDALFGAGPYNGDAAEIGCGYGTFTLTAAQRITGTLHAFDIDATMLAQSQARAKQAQFDNIAFHLRDVLHDGLGLAANSLDCVLIFNLLHTATPEVLLRQARAALRPGATLAIIHWRSDIATPRGPDLSIRPRPEQVQQWLQQAAFGDVKTVAFDQRNPYHYGMVASKAPA